MQSMGISEFKAKALKILDLIAKSHEGLMVTKRGKPLVKILPCNGDEETTEFKAGQLADTLVFEKDLVSPLGQENWESCE